MGLRTWKWAIAILVGQFAGLLIAGAILVAPFYFFPELIVGSAPALA
ncbi:hypothetical protein V1291_004861 [Nitrobacteraceae bacterium AZCC 1564]